MRVTIGKDGIDSVVTNDAEWGIQSRVLMIVSDVVKDEMKVDDNLEANNDIIIDLARRVFEYSMDNVRYFYKGQFSEDTVRRVTWKLLVE